MAPLPSPGAAAPRPFTFDTVFDGGRVIEPVRPKRVFTPEEVEAARAQARAEGERSAVARAEAEAAAALADAARSIRAALDALKALAHEHRVASAELALACGRAIAGEALARFPEAAATAALESLAREVEAQPRLIVRGAPDAAERLGQALARTAEAIGYAGAVQVKADPALPPAAFAFEWGDGRAAFDPQAASARVGEALAAALASEGLHAEAPLADHPDLEPDA